jgi:hypothetical protein
MKKMLTLIATTALLIGLFAPTTRAGEAKASPALKDGEHYLAYNVWYENPDRLYSINYKRGNILPAGSVVSKVRVEPGRTPKIHFHHNEYETDFVIHFTKKYHGTLTAEKFKDRMLTDKPIEELTKDMSDLEKDAIQAGQVSAGMSKEAVLIAWGYPPEHRTVSIKAPSWIFWTSRFVNKTLQFDQDGKLR